MEAITDLPASLAVGAPGALMSDAVIHARGTAQRDDSLDVFSCHGLAGVAGARWTDVCTTRSANPAGR
jgi:Amt family ammonium transporter